MQDLTSLAELNQEYEPQSQTPEPFTEPFTIYSTPQQPVYTGYSQVYPGSYQATHDSNHLAQEVQSGSVYVQQQKATKSFSKKPKAVQQQEAEIAEEEDEDLYYIFYDKVGYRDQSLHFTHPVYVYPLENIKPDTKKNNLSMNLSMTLS